jgi:uncharacterized protein (TIGR02145 family)
VPVAAEVITEGCCDAPGATGVTFADFNPCSGASYNSTYTLTDARDSKTYKVKYLADGRYWMVQDLKFGDLCNKTAFSGSTSDRTGNINSTGTYYGDCRSNLVDCGGYYYDWPALVNKPGAYNGSTSYAGCSGTTTAANACQGICPDGWHLPTKEEYDVLLENLHSIYNCTKANCMYIYMESCVAGYVFGDQWERNEIVYLTSTYRNIESAYQIAASHPNMGTDINGHKATGYTNRCLMNK